MPAQLSKDCDRIKSLLAGCGRRRSAFWNCRGCGPHGGWHFGAISDLGKSFLVAAGKFLEQTDRPFSADVIIVIRGDEVYFNRALTAAMRMMARASAVMWDNRRAVAKDALRGEQARH